MINGDRPTLGPNAGRKARKVDSACARRCFRWLGLACCTGWAQTRLSTTGIWEMSDKGRPLWSASCTTSSAWCLLLGPLALPGDGQANEGFGERVAGTYFVEHSSGAFRVITLNSDGGLSAIASSQGGSVFEGVEFTSQQGT